MRSIFSAVSFTFLTLLLVSVGHANTGTNTSVNFKPEDIKWMPAGDAVPAGAEVAVLQGDPSKAEPFTIRMKMPANFKVAPHTHPNNEAVTIISGQFTLGNGKKMDKSKATTFGPGGFFTMDSTTAHYAMAGGEGAVIQISSTGPWDVIYTNPGDDPRKASTKKQR